MSWELFKQNIVNFSNSPDRIPDIDTVAKKWAKEYDAAIKRGFDTLNGASVKKGNVELMEKLFKLALKKGLSSTSPYGLVSEMGNGVLVYWTGALLNELPIPLIPAPGSILNVAVVNNTVSNAGVWITEPAPMSAVKPTNDTSVIVDEFIKYAIQHLNTVSGIVTTTSLYPPVAQPGPGILLWSGYQIPPATPGVSIPELPNNRSVDTSPIKMSDEQLAAAEDASLNGGDINSSTNAGYNSNGGGGGSRSVISDARSFPDPQLPADALPIDGIEQIPNYKTNVKVPPEIVLAMRKYGIGKTPLERAHFLAQCAHESGGFIFREELASGAAYEGRLDLGNIQPGDGVKFKGRGYIQLTGRANYTRFGPVAGANFVINPKIVAQQYYAETACLFWTANRLGEKCIDSSILTVKVITRRINGDYNGLDDRVRRFAIYWKEVQRDPKLWT